MRGIGIWGMDGAVYCPAYDNAAACHIAHQALDHAYINPWGGGHTAVIAPSRGVMESGPVP